MTPDYSWMDDLSLRVKRPTRPHALPFSVRVALIACVLALSFGALIAAGWV